MAAAVATDALVKHLLATTRNIVVLGYSTNASRPSNHVSEYMQSVGYKVVGVNPAAAGAKDSPVPVVATLAEAVKMIDTSNGYIVDVFRKASDIPAVIDEVVAIGSPVIWVQLGIWNQEAAEYGESKGLTVVMDRCIKVEHARFNGGLHLLGFDTGQISSRRTLR